jgi:nitrate/nitrite transporter NarK
MNACHDTTDKQIGQLGAITPAVTFVVAPLWGALADQTGRHKDVLLVTFVSSVVSRLLFIWRVRCLPYIHIHISSVYSCSLALSLSLSQAQCRWWYDAHFFWPS